MHTELYAPWDHQPKFLSYKQVQNPLSIVDDFYSVDSIGYHRKFLKKWRKAVLSKHHFTNSYEGPCQLVFMHELNVQLLEASYLLFLNYQTRWPKKKLTDEDLEKAKANWSYFPQNLSEKQLRDPYLALKKLFRKMLLQEYRDHLQVWLTYALNNSPVSSETYIPGDLITIYERLLKLYSATWIIYQIEIHMPSLKEREATLATNKVLPTSTGNTVTGAAPVCLPHIAIKPFGPMLTPAEKLGLVEVITLITNAMPFVKAIIYMGIHPHPFTYYLLVLTDDQDTAKDHDISHKIEELCQPLVSVFILVHKVRNAKKGINDGRRFWSLVIDKGIIAYQAPAIEFPPAKAVAKEMMLNRAVANWQKWGVQGEGFLKTAKQSVEDGNYILGIFNLHQAAESTMIGIINVLFGYRLSIHNLHRMLRLSLLFTDELLNVFELDTELGAQAFKVLQKAYTEARYLENYQPDQVLVGIAMERVELLLAKANGIYQQVTGS